MYLTEDEVITVLCVRLGAREADQDIHFHFDSCSRWQPGTLEGLLASRLLRTASDADWIVCQKCDERCARPVEVQIAGGSARIVCEQRDGVSSLPVAPERLQRWRTSRRALAAFVGSELSARQRNADAGHQRVRFQSVWLGKFRVSLSLEFAEGKTELRIGRDQRQPLDDLIIWRHGKPRLDLHALQILAQEVQGSGRDYQPSVVKRKRQAAKYQARNVEWQHEADVLKNKHPGMSKEQIAESIFKSGTWRGVETAATIKRVIRVKKSGRKKVASPPQR